MIGVGTCKISHKAKEYVNQVLDSGRLSYGPFTQKFERSFAASHDCRFAVMSNSGTCALMVALAALRNKYGWHDGDEVLVPAVTFIATSNIVIQLNLKPVFVDIDPVYYEIDPQKIETAITPRTKCIIPVHLFGHPCDMDPIMEIAHKYNLKIIEDSCETMFARYKGKAVGSFGEIGCFSTYVAHILITGVGGLCITNDPGLATDIRSLINHGRDSIYISIDDDKDKTNEEFELIVKKRFSFVQMGYSFRVTEMEGALGLAEFEDHQHMMKVRRENARYLIDNLMCFSEYIQLPSTRNGADHSFMMFPIVLKKEKKDELVQYLEKNGIETRDMLPLINQPFYKRMFNIKEEDYPVAKWVNESGFYVASHHGLTVSEREYIVKVFRSYFEKKKIEIESACLVIMSKLKKRPSELVLAKLYESLPLESFDEFYLLDASELNDAVEFFSKRNFIVIRDNIGKGALLKRALKEIKSNNIVLMGIDGADDINDLDSILIKLKEGNDLVIASRFMTGGARESDRFLSYRSIGNRFFSFLISVFVNKNISDCNNIFRGFKKSAYQRVELFENAESFMFEMTMKFLERGFPYTEIPTHEKVGNIKCQTQYRFKSALSFMWILIKNIFKK